MRSHSSYVVAPEQGQYSQNYRIKKTKASAVHENHTEAKNPSEEKVPKQKIRSFVVKKSGKAADENTSKQIAGNENSLKSNPTKVNNTEQAKENKIKASIKTNLKGKEIDLSADKYKNGNQKFAPENQKVVQNLKGGKIPKKRPESENRNMKDFLFQPIFKDNVVNDSNGSSKGHNDINNGNQTNGTNVYENPSDLTPEKAKKLLYLQNNEIKTAFNYFSEENKKLETKIKQMRKEREKVEKEIANMKGTNGPRVHMNNFIQSPVFNDSTNALKQVLKERKERVQQIQNELKELRKNLKDESILTLTNESLNLASRIHELKEEIQNFNAEEIEEQFTDIKNLKGINNKLVQQKNAMTVYLLEASQRAQSKTRTDESANKL
jgi:hypothetical protein